MRVTIKHRDELAGLLGDKRKFLLDVSIEFLQEEYAIIEKRKLYHTEFDLSPGFLASSTFFVPSGLIKFCLIASPFLFLSGCMVSCVGAISGSGESFGVLMIFLSVLAVGFGIYAAYFTRRGYRTEVTIAEMLRGFSVLTFSPPDAKTLDDLIRQRLVVFKEFLDESAELSPKQTFEI
jgi:hypothetical protein